MGIHADCGFADPVVMSYTEEKGWYYKAISYLQQHPDFWETPEEKEEEIRFATEDDHWAAADIPILLNNWTKARRCFIYRESHETEHTTMMNLLFCWIKVIPYNVVVWFKQAFLPDSLQRCEVKTIRRVVLKVPGNVVGSGRYQHILLSPSPVPEAIDTVIKERAREIAKRLIHKIPEAA